MSRPPDLGMSRALISLQTTRRSGISPSTTSRSQGRTDARRALSLALSRALAEICEALQGPRGRP